MTPDHRARKITLTLFLTTLVAYGLFITRTGFYWDDWPFAWIANFFGPAEFVPAFDGVRPFLGPIFLATTSLLPPVPVYWQIFMVLIRFAAGLLTWFTLNQTWPQHQKSVLAASFLFLLFPGYSQHWVAFTHINQEWIPFLFYLLSFGLTAYALRNPSSFYKSTALSLLFLVAGVFPTEYFVSIEVMRFFFIAVILHEQLNDLKQTILRSIKLWFPYLLVWLANGLWLAYFYTLGNYDSYDVEVVKEPLSLSSILSVIVETVWKIGFYIWGQIVLLIGNSVTAPSSLLALALIGAAFLFFVYYLSRSQPNTVETKIFAFTTIITGLAGILAGRVPSFAAGLPLTLQSSFDRLTISMMLGGSLFIVGLVELIIRNVRVKNVIFALLIALAVGQQFFNANIFRRDWEKQQQIYWQLAWRIPDMEPGTALFTDEMPIDYETDLSFTAPINWMYAPDYQPESDLPYALFNVEKRLGRQSLPSLAPDTDILLGMRSATFRGSTSKVIVIFMPKNGCLRVLDPALKDEKTYARESRYLVNAVVLSKPELIRVDSTQTPQIPFIPEPEHTWCYYFTKAELARQKGDWQQVNVLFNKARSLGYHPGDEFEWLVFIEGQAMMGDLESAQGLAKDAMESDVRVRRGVCEVWKRVQATGPVRGVDGEQVKVILSEMQCAP